MKLNELKPNEGAKHNYKRVGRGIGSGKGKTSGVGVKGQKARSGVAVKGFEGGQMPLYMRLPKHGFTNIFGKEYATITLARLQQAIDSKLIDAKGTIDEDALLKNKVISNKRDGVRLIGGGELKTKVALKISGATKSATDAVSKAGGSIDLIKIVVAPVVRKKAK
jgi:large subunit ribosomal protein L15